jgi:ABC-type transport system involved in multi-copper enzyme maturation permease subunit
MPSTSPVVHFRIALGMPSQIITIARNAFAESTRQPLYLLLIALSGFLQIMSTWSTGFAMGYTESGEVSSDNKLLLDIGMGSIFIFATLLSAFIATAVLSREIENKTVLTVVSKPVGRPSLVIGKYLGVAAAISLAALTMIMFLLLSLRHGVLSNASDELDGPVIVFGVGLPLIGIALAGWANFYYGWNFPQTAAMLMAPLSVVAYVVVLFVSKKWHLQPLLTDVKPQIYLGCISLLLSTLVLTAVAVAASTRLSQVTTILICVGVFIASLLSNHFIGRRAYHNQQVAQIRIAVPNDPAKSTFQTLNEAWTITLALPPTKPLAVGDAFYFGASPNGSDIAVPASSGEPAQGVVVSEVLGAASYIVRNQLTPPSKPSRAPVVGDWVFLKPTKVNAVALAGWAALPNMQHFWLLDAITQNQKIPVRHVGLIAIYALGQIGAILSLAVVFFQTRDVG